jgi:hypothetical protein
MKKGLPATPSCTLTWPASRIGDFTDSDICIYVDHIIPVVIARPFSALPPSVFCNNKVNKADTQIWQSLRRL